MAVHAQVVGDFGLETFATSPSVLDAVESVLGPHLVIWATELFAKQPRDPSRAIGCHRDRAYLGFDSDRAVTAWVALSPCGEKNRNESVATCVVLQPGDMSLQDSGILHGSRPNLSTEKRVGFAVRFVDPSVRPRPGRPDGVLARGRDDYGHFQLRGRPDPTSSERALEGLTQSALRHFDAILENLSSRDRRGSP